MLWTSTGNAFVRMCGACDEETINPAARNATAVAAPLMGQQVKEAARSNTPRTKRRTRAGHDSTGQVLR